MKTKKFHYYLAVLLVATLSGIFMASCSDDNGDSFTNDGRFEGTWEVLSGLGTGTKVTFSGNNYTLFYAAPDYDKGTFTFISDTITFRCTEYMEGGTLYTDVWSDTCSYVLNNDSLTITWYQDDPIEPEYTYSFTKQP